MTYHEILKHYWGYDSFRSIQEQIIESIGSGRDTLGLMPTGGGKSLTFQVPALAKEGTCIVVTPLIALMKDQVQNLCRRGIKAAAIYTGLGRQDIIDILENCIFGDYKFLYVSPERLSTDLFRQKLKHIQVSLIAVDEAHCISQWGYDFRPSYLNITDLRKLLPQAPVIALTATATPAVAKDIQQKLGFKEENIFSMSFLRENLSYVVRKTENKLEEIKHILDGVPGTSIVYVRNRRETKEIADWLNAQGISARHFHAGLDSGLKNRRQAEWTENRFRVIVATNAFGMGIDKPDVRSVIHYEMPDSIEAYFQEAGRAGRDLRRSYAVLLFSPGDSRTVSRRVSDRFPKTEFVRKVYDKLSYHYEMAMGCGAGCRYNFSLSEFCESFSLPLLQTESALQLLTRMGYIEYIDETDFSAKVMFTASREHLYHIHFPNAVTEDVVNLLLRFYSGLFTDYAYIDEQMICSRLNIGHETLYNTLTSLDGQGAISYVPARKTSMIVWSRGRVDSRMLNFLPEVYEERKSEYGQRVKAMIDYVTRQTGCRSRFLLDYFGQSDSRPCFKCDLCVENHVRPLTDYEFTIIANSVRPILEESPAERGRVYDLPFERYKIEEVIHRLALEEKIPANK